jgi:hypothetical protein
MISNTDSPGFPRLVHRLAGIPGHMEIVEMTNWREIEDLKSDPEVAKRMARSLLQHAQLTDWEEPFLERIEAITKPLSTRQAEKLVEIRDQNLFVSVIGLGFSVRLLLKACYDARFELGDPDDTKFIERLHSTVVTTARYRDARRLLACARELHVVDD